MVGADDGLADNKVGADDGLTDNDVGADDGLTDNEVGVEVGIEVGVADGGQYFGAIMTVTGVPSKLVTLLVTTK
jgi:hypothetical protein